MNNENLKHQSRHETVLKEYYARYLTDVRGLKKSTVLHYFDALNNISRRLKEKGLVKNDIYEVADLEQLKELREILFHDEDFIVQNERGKRMYSAGMNNYYRFASGDGFKNAQEKLYMLDMGGGEGCYIATAVYGSYDCPQVWILRRYRDFALKQSFTGRLFVCVYYTVSPILIKLFGKEKWFNNSCKKILDKLVTRLRADGYNDNPYND